MERKYKASAALRVFSLGLCKHAVRIENGVLRTTCAPLPNMKPIKIKDILSVRCYEKGTYYRGTTTYCIYYEFAVKGKAPQYLRYNVLDGDTMQRLLKDLKMINPNIFFTPEVKAFVNTPIPKYKIHLDFTPIDGQPKAEQYAKTQRPFILQHPSVNVAHSCISFLIEMSSVVLFMLILCGSIFLLPKGVSVITTPFIVIAFMTSIMPFFELSMSVYGIYRGWKKIETNVTITILVLLVLFVFCLFFGVNWWRFLK